MNLNQLINTVSNMASQGLAASGEAVNQVGQAVQVATQSTSQIFSGAPIDGAIDVAGRVFDFVMDDENNGESMSVDKGKSPKPFGYGKLKETLGELDLGPKWNATDTDVRGSTINTMNELAAKARLFGHASMERLTASIGAEGELGYRGTRETIFANGRMGPMEEAFVGMRGRVFGEAGRLGVGMGVDTFLGAVYHSDYEYPNYGTGEDWKTFRTQVEVGVRGAASMNVGLTGADLYGRMQAGLDFRYADQEHDALGGSGGFGLMHNTRVNAFVGAVAEAKVNINPLGASAGVDAFAGARASIQRGLGLAWDGASIFGVVGKAEARAGIGYTAKVEYGFNWEEKTFGLSGEAGAAVLVGFGLGGGITIGSKELAKTFGIDAE